MTSPLPFDQLVLWVDYLDDQDYAVLHGVSDGGEGGGRPPGNFPVDVFPTATQSLRIAWGADPTGDPDLWRWTDITTDALWEDGVTIKIGDANETPRTPPAQLDITLRNDQPNGGDYTIGNALGRNWPHVRENVPVEAVLNLGSGDVICFSGYVTAWPPTWDAARKYAIVRLQAHGAPRRLVQGKAAAQSAMWRFHMLADRYPTNTNGGGDFGIGAAEYLSSGQGYHAAPVHFWPLEESSGALQAANVTMPSYPLKAPTTTELPSFGSSAIGSGSKSSATFSTGQRLVATFPAVAPGADTTGLYPGVTSLVIPFLLNIPELPAATVELARFYTSGTAAQYRIFLDPTGGLSIYVKVYDAVESLLATMASVDDSEALNSVVWFMLRLDQNGSDVVVEIDYSVHAPDLADGSASADSAFNTVTVAGRTLGGLTGFVLGPGQDLPGVSISMMGVYNGGLGTFPSTHPRAVLGRRGDTPTTRLQRTCLEDGITLELVGSSDILMGPQANGSFLDIIDECKAVDGGLLLNGLNPGFTYIARTQLYSQPAALTLDYTDGVITSMRTAQDDQGRINVFTATNPGGGERTFTKVDGELGTDDVGTYDSSSDVPVSLDAALYDQAAWRVYQSTAGGRRIRYPGLGVHFEKPAAAPLAQRWLELLPGARIDAIALEQGARPDRSLMLRGWVLKWNSKTLTADMFLTDYRAWSVGTMSAETGDTGEFAIRLDTDSSTLVAGVSPGDTVLSVASSGQVWVHSAVSTYADDLVGLVLDVDGLPLDVVSIVGASSPQAITVVGAGILRPIPAGATVQLRDPTVLGL